MSFIFVSARTVSPTIEKTVNKDEENHPERYIVSDLLICELKNLRNGSSTLRGNHQNSSRVFMLQLNNGVTQFGLTEVVTCRS